ncbi:MAG: hypothetical protein M3016_03790 [Actinomycetota bacterium]|nr:hypothetical protein [Actinomycetota bacterium]
MSPRAAPDLFLAVLVALALSGCGSAAPSRSPTLAGVPLPPGSRVLAHVTRCDRGANAYCAVQLVVSGPGYHSSEDLLGTERRHLMALGWGLANADTGDEHAAESPGHKLRLIYATAALDLKDVDLGWVRRSRRIQRGLSAAMFDRIAALSLMLEPGSS